MRTHKNPIKYGPSVVFTWSFFYVLIVAFSLLVNMSASFRLSRSLKDEAYQATNSLLYQTKQSVEVRLDDIRRIAQLIGANTNVKSFLASPAHTSYPAVEYSRIIVDLRNYQSSNSLIKQIYVIPHGANVAISSSAVLRGGLFEQLMTEELCYRDGNGFDLENSRHYNETVLFTPQGTDVKTAIGLVQTLPEGIASRLDATLVVLMDQPALLSNLDTGSWIKKNAFYIMDQNNQIISSLSPLELPESICYDDLEQRDNQSVLPLDGKQYTLMQTTSATNGWKYLVLIPSQLLLQDYNRMQELMWFTTVLIIALATAVAIYLARQSYVPLQNLIHMAENETGLSFSRRENEFSFLRAATENIVSERQELNAILNQQRESLRGRFLARLLKNQLLEDMPLSEEMRIYDVHFTSDRFLVMVIYICEIFSAPGPKKNLQRQRIKDAIKAVFEDAVGPESSAFVIEIDDMQAILVNLPPQGDARAVCDQACQQVKDGIRRLEEGHIASLTVATSDLAQSVSALPEAYINAYTAVEYCILMSRTGFIAYSDVVYGAADGGNTYYYYYPLQVETQMTNAIKAGNRELAQSVLDKLFRLNFEEHSIPRPIARCFMFNLTSTIIRTVYELDLSSVGEFESSISSIESLLNCKSISEIKQEMDSVLTKLCSYARDQKAKDAFPANIKAYIAENYGNCSLDIPDIAEHFSLTPSYLSKKFKSTANIGLLDYINTVRSEKAAEMLLNTNESIARIAETCGFVNSNTFIRVFKKHQGVTPGKYRGKPSE